MKNIIRNSFYIIFFLFAALLSSCHRNQEEPTPSSPGLGFTVNDFSKSTAISIVKNSRIKGTSMVMACVPESPEAEIGDREYFDVSKGFESAFSFSGQSAGYLQIRMHSADSSIYNPYGISTILNENVFNIGHSITNTLTCKSMPTLFDSKTHTVKIQVQNISDQGLLTKIFIDNMDEAAFVGNDSTSFGRKELYATGIRAKRRISLMFFNYNSGQGEVSIYNWSFKPL